MSFRCVASKNQSDWSVFLPWVEYAHNSLPSAATGMSPFVCALGYLPPLFPEQERDVGVPSVNCHLLRCRAIWQCARASLLHSAEKCREINTGRQPRSYQPGESMAGSWRHSPDGRVPKTSTPVH